MHMADALLAPSVAGTMYDVTPEMKRLLDF